MKILLFILSLMMLCQVGIAQNTHLDYKYAIKLYNLSSSEVTSRTIRPNGNNSTHMVATNTDIQMLHPTLAFQWRTKKHNFHEIEFTGIRLNKALNQTMYHVDSTNMSRVLQGYQLTSSLISIRYEYIVNFNKQRQTKLIPSLGFGFNPYFKHKNYIPSFSSSYPSSEKFLGLRAFVTPRLSYYLSSKFFIDVNIPICAFDTYGYSSNNENPTITPSGRTSMFDYDAFPQIFSGRIGIGMKL